VVFDRGGYLYHGRVKALAMRPASGSGVLMQRQRHSAARRKRGAGWRPAANWQSARIGAVEIAQSRKIKDLAVAAGITSHFPGGGIVAHALMRAASALIADASCLSAQRRRGESRRCTQDCVRHDPAAKLFLRNRLVATAAKRGAKVSETFPQRPRGACPLCAEFLERTGVLTAGSNG